MKKEQILNMKRSMFFKLPILLALLFTTPITIVAQEVEVQGELKVTEMNENEDGENLVIHNSDGSLGTRTVASLPTPPPPIDSIRNLASDYELAKHLCDCPNLPPFLIKNLLDSGYTEEDLLDAGVPYSNIKRAQFTCGEELLDIRDGQMYSTVRIGGQCWMSENLNIGTMINAGTDQLNNSIIEKYCYEDGGENCENYGGLYQWDEMMQYVTTESSQGICPEGWHIPSNGEITTLEVQLGMTQAQAELPGIRGTNQGSKLAGNSVLWDSGVLVNDPEFGTSGFTAIPAGVEVDGFFHYMGEDAVFFTSTEDDAVISWTRTIKSSYSQVDRNNVEKYFGLSVRCIRD